MTPLIQTLGQSLDHWQALYIISISLALISTFAMVFFAFHKEHPVALRTSNYVYVIASFLAVLSTIVVVVKAKSLDAEKDRVSGLQIAKAQGDAAKAKLDAATATANAATAQDKAEEARQKAESIHAKAEEARRNSLEAERQANEAVIDKEKILRDNLALQKKVETERISRLQLEQRLAPRGLLKNSQDSLSAKVKPFAGTSIDMVVVSGNSEAQALAGQIAFGLKAGGIEFHILYPMGGSTQGVGIEYEPANDSAHKIAQAIHDALADSSITSELIPMLPPMEKQIGAYTSDGGPETGKGKVRIFIGNKP